MRPQEQRGGDEATAPAGFFVSGCLLACSGVVMLRASAAPAPLFDAGAGRALARAAPVLAVLGVARRGVVGAALPVLPVSRAARVPRLPYVRHRSRAPWPRRSSARVPAPRP